MKYLIFFYLCVVSDKICKIVHLKMHLFVNSNYFEMIARIHILVISKCSFRNACTEFY